MGLSPSPIRNIFDFIYIVFGIIMIIHCFHQHTIDEILIAFNLFSNLSIVLLTWFILFWCCTKSESNNSNNIIESHQIYKSLLHKYCSKCFNGMNGFITILMRGPYDPSDIITCFHLLRMLLQIHHQHWYLIPALTCYPNIKTPSSSVLWILVFGNLYLRVLHILTLSKALEHTLKLKKKGNKNIQLPENKKNKNDKAMSVMRNANKNKNKNNKKQIKKYKTDRIHSQAAPINDTSVRTAKLKKITAFQFDDFMTVPKKELFTDGEKYGTPTPIEMMPHSPKFKGKLGEKEFQKLGTDNKSESMDGTVIYNPNTQDNDTKSLISSLSAQSAKHISDTNKRNKWNDTMRRTHTSGSGSAAAATPMISQSQSQPVEFMKDNNGQKSIFGTNASNGNNSGCSTPQKFSSVSASNLKSPYLNINLSPLVSDNDADNENEMEIEIEIEMDIENPEDDIFTVISDMENEFNLSNEDFIEHGKNNNLGVGASGIVKKAFHFSSCKLLAIKHCRSLKKDKLLAFEKEANLYRKFIDNKYIIEIIGIGKGNKNNELIMGLEFMDLNSCQSLQIHKNIKNMCLRENIIGYIAWNILQGLQCLHSNLYVHNDIKPANILVNKYGEIKISDFDTVLQLHGQERNQRIGHGQKRIGHGQERIGQGCTLYFYDIKLLIYIYCHFCFHFIFKKL